ncbi:MAG: cytochrome c [Magnetococcales bacterium]|nr:cytochrome c [Magnetococcales bacterium]MBF0156613.1 cytochrome c [Magnetococcales bacterium]
MEEMSFPKNSEADAAPDILAAFSAHLSAAGREDELVDVTEVLIPLGAFLGHRNKAFAEASSCDLYEFVEESLRRRRLAHPAKVASVLVDFYSFLMEKGELSVTRNPLGEICAILIRGDLPHEENDAEAFAQYLARIERRSGRRRGTDRRRNERRDHLDSPVAPSPEREVLPPPDPLKDRIRPPLVRPSAPPVIAFDAGDFSGRKRFWLSLAAAVALVGMVFVFDLRDYLGRLPPISGLPTGSGVAESPSGKEPAATDEPAADSPSSVSPPGNDAGRLKVPPPSTPEVRIPSPVQAQQVGSKKSFKAATGLTRKEYFYRFVFPEFNKKYLGIDNDAKPATRINPLTTSWDTLNSGRLLFGIHCERCHGSSGRVSGTDPRQSKESLSSNLSLSGSGLLHRDAFLYWAIAEGGTEHGLEMPAFRDTLSEEEIWHLVLLIPSL